MEGSAITYINSGGILFSIIIDILCNEALAITSKNSSASYLCSEFCGRCACHTFTEREGAEQEREPLRPPLLLVPLEVLKLEPPLPPPETVGGFSKLASKGPYPRLTPLVPLVPTPW